MSEVGIDLGTANISVYLKDKGMVISEPSVVAINTDTDQILAVGEEAKQMIGRTPGNIITVRPLKDGVISNYSITERMLKYYIKKTCGYKKFSKPKIMISVPSGVTEVEKRAITEAATQAGGKAVYLIEEPIAAAIGAGIDITKPDGIMIIDIGGGTTDVAVISLGGIVTSKLLKVAGDNFDEEIIKYIRKKYTLSIGERTAEEMKMTLGSAYQREDVIMKDYSGRDLVSGLPKKIEVTSDEIQEALDESMQIICGAIHEVLEQTPPEISADISINGIIVNGGGALLYGIDKRIEETIGIRATIAEDPRSCVAIGTGKALEYMNTFEKSKINQKKSYY